MHETRQDVIRDLVRTQVKAFALAFEIKHVAELENPEGVINSKVNNVFIAALGDEVRFYSALVRSLDSSLGSLVEAIALSIAHEHFEVTRHVEGKLYDKQTSAIASLLADYKTHRKQPSIEDYQSLRTLTTGAVSAKRHDSDYILKHRATGAFSLIELKLGGDLDNKKARSEKEALLEQFCILTNREGSEARVDLKFATGYNRYGEGKPWSQGRVLQYFAKDELLISSDFWNFVTQSPRGYEIVLEEYKQNAVWIGNAIEKVKSVYIKHQ